MIKILEQLGLNLLGLLRFQRQGPTFVELVRQRDKALERQQELEDHLTLSTTVNQLDTELKQYYVLEIQRLEALVLVKNQALRQLCFKAEGFLGESELELQQAKKALNE